MAGSDGWEDVPDGQAPASDGGWEDVPMDGNAPQLTKPVDNSFNGIINDNVDDAIRTAGSLAAGLTNPVGVVKGLYEMGKGAAARIAAPVERVLDNLYADPERASLEKDLATQRAAARAKTFDQFVQQKDQKYVGRDANGAFDPGATLDKLGYELTHHFFSTGLDLASVMAPATDVAGDFATAAKLPGLTRAVNAAQTVNNFMNPLTLVEKGAPLVGKFASLPVSVLSGMSPQAQALIMKGAYAGGDAAKAMMGQVRGTQSMNVPLDLLDSALAKIKARGMLNYGRNETLWKGDPTILNHQPIFDALSRAEGRSLSESGTPGTVNATTGATTPTTGFQKDPLAVQKINEMRDIVLDHLTDPNESHNVESFDALKQRLGTVIDSVPPGSRAQAAVLDAYNATKQAILDQTPGYASAMKDYEEMLDTVNDIKRSFSAGGNASKDTILGKLQSALRDDVSGRYGYRQTMLDALAKEEPSLPYVLAGQAGRAPLSRGIAGRLTELGSLLEMSHEPVTAGAAIAASSPRLVSEGINLGGKLGRLGDRLGLGKTALSRKFRAGYQAGQTDDANEVQPGLLGLLGGLTQ